jgi:glycosyltransferase involved in cell wall biosynthesis
MRRAIGIYDLAINGGGGAEKRSAVMAERLARKHDVWLIVGESCSVQHLQDYFAVDLGQVKVLRLRMPFDRKLKQLLQTDNGPRFGKAAAETMIYSLRRDLDRTYFSQIQSLGLDLFINNQGGSNLRCPAPFGIYMCMFPHPMRSYRLQHQDGNLLYRAYSYLFHSVFGLSSRILDSYQVITANSRFTAEWTVKRWSREPIVVYSACEDMGPPGPKENVILHTGRFVAEHRGDYKHQRTLLEAFRGMPELARQGWELHFAGTVLADAASKLAVDRLERDASALPVHIHRSIGMEALRQLYRKASIYWHATGYGASPASHPGWQEHFGITTVEAMSAGAVPVVIDSGGQRETVKHEVNGFRWSDLTELQNYTRRLVEDLNLRRALSENAVRASAPFRRSNFADRIEQIVDSFPSA